MKHILISLLALAGLASGQAVGDYTLTRRAALGNTPVIITPVPGSVIVWDGSGVATNLDIAATYVPQTRTINGSPLSSNVTISTVTGNAGTATTLATGRTLGITGDLVWTSPTFNGSGNVTAAGTLATVATAGTTGSSTAIPVITIDAKGRTTGITTAAVIAPAGTLTGTVLNGTVVSSSLTSVGTLGSLTVSGAATLPTVNGGVAANDDITIQGTTSGTRTTSYVILQPTAGNVGIGTAAPTQRLHVAGNAIVGDIDLRYGGTTGGNNTFYGLAAGNNTTTAGGGVNNCGFGAAALAGLTSGDSNMGFGSYALQTMSTGTENIGVGIAALVVNNGNTNTAIGHNSFGANTSGGANVGIGGYTGAGNGTGAGNTLIGTYAGYSNTGGSNIFIGFAAGNDSTSASNCIVIGYNIDPQSASGANQMTIGNMIFGTGIDGTGTTASTGGIGIAGVPAASAVFDVQSTTKAFLPPRMTKTQRDAIASPTAGMVIYQTDNTPGLRVRNGSNWMKFTETTD